MLLLVPGYSGEHYLARNRVVYGVLPTLLSFSLLTSAAWLWKRSGESGTLSTYVQRAFLGAVGLLLLFWFGLIVVAHLRGMIP